MRALELQGKHFGQLFVVDSAEKLNGKRRWLCHCDCGTWRILPTERLTCDNTKSCGCLRKEKCAAIGKQSRFLTAPGEAGFSAALRKYRWSAKNRGHVFDLTVDQFRTLTQCRCHYCGREPSQTTYGSGKKYQSIERTAYRHSGIDRKDPALGYTVDNCVPACTDCNLAKQSLSHDAFLRLVSNIYSNRIKESA